MQKLCDVIYYKNIIPVAVVERIITIELTVETIKRCLTRQTIEK